MLDSIVNEDKKYHLQILLKECKYSIRKKKIINNEELIINNEELKLHESDDDEYMMMNIIFLNAKIIL